MSNKIIKSCMALAMAVMMLTATVLADPAQSTVDWEKGVVRATGLAAGNSKTKNKGLYRAQAKRAARMDAQRNLAEAVEGVQVSSESSMRDLMLEYDIVKTRVDATIKGMSEIDSRYYDDGTCEILLEMPLYGQTKSVAEAAFLPARNQPKVPFPQPTSTSIKIDVDTAVGGVVDNGYTGLVVDCSGLGLEAVMSPVIQNNNNQPIYGVENLDIDKVIEMGMASYANSADDSISQARAGNHPLVVKAVKVNGIIKGNPVLSVADADKVLIANQSDMFLDECAVVFVK
ncbi:MAG: LPP20 family lipoprotein [Selenomonadaceae bacterium]|nr:LPP20 family lipoprotein [Selenomonadaceae bacterium]